MGGCQSLQRPSEDLPYQLQGTFSYERQADDKLIFVPLDQEKNKYTSISICVEAIRDPQLESYQYSVPNHLLEFNVCLEHGASAAQRHSDSCKTVGEIFGQGKQETSSQLPTYRACRVRTPIAITYDRLNALLVERPERECS
jgi:hypothetical protein